MMVVANENRKQTQDQVGGLHIRICDAPATHNNRRTSAPRPKPEVEAALKRGTDQLERGHISAAIAHFRAALALDPASVSARIYLGTACAVDAEVYQAIEVFEEALALSPSDFLANLKLGELYLRLCVPEKARKYLEMAMEVSRTPGERELVRRLLALEAGRERRRIDRPSFGPRSRPWDPAGRGWWNRLRGWFGADWVQ